jgi:hypothetical protein
MQNEIEKVITSIRNSAPNTVKTYTQGCCYGFFEILRTIFGQDVEAWYDTKEGHIYSKIGKYWYDITGIHYKVSKECKPLNFKDININLIDGKKCKENNR